MINVFLNQDDEHFIVIQSAIRLHLESLSHWFLLSIPFFEWESKAKQTDSRLTNDWWSNMRRGLMQQSHSTFKGMLLHSDCLQIQDRKKKQTTVDTSIKLFTLWLTFWNIYSSGEGDDREFTEIKSQGFLEKSNLRMSSWLRYDTTRFLLSISPTSDEASSRVKVRILSSSLRSLFTPPLMCGLAVQLKSVVNT